MGDKNPLGAAMNKGLTIKTGQTHVQAYLIEDGKIDLSSSHTRPASKTRPRCTRSSGTRRTA
jgi:threonine dehydrogenase-like Zn-dependent dehydrogenase